MKMQSNLSQMAASYMMLVPLLYRKMDARDETRPERKEHSELTHLQLHILEELHPIPEGISLTQLSKNIRVSKQQLTPLIAKLIEKNYLLKTPDEADKRSVKLRLSEKGKQTVTKRWEKFHGQLRSQIGRLSEEDQLDLQYALTKMTAILQRME